MKDYSNAGDKEISALLKHSGLRMMKELEDLPALIQALVVFSLATSALAFFPTEKREKLMKDMMDEARRMGGSLGGGQLGGE